MCGVKRMSIFISDIAENICIQDTLKLVDEKPFDYFARATTEVNGTKCIFVSNKKYLNSIDSSVAMVITSADIAEIIGNRSYGLCITNNARGTFFELMSEYERREKIDYKETIIGKGCEISRNAVIADHNVIIGDNVKVGDFAVIHPNTVIGDNVIIQTGARIGEQDFNVYSYKGISKQVYHSGKIQIGSNVLISAGVLIGQALYSYDTTVIGDNCFIGANTCIGHNSKIKDNCEICGNSILGGFCSIGSNSKLFMNVTVANATSIGDNVTVNMGSVVIRGIKDSKTVFGNPAREIITPK